MSTSIAARLSAVLFCMLLTVAIGPYTARAQSGSAGGSIGNDEKSLSGSRSASPERATRSSRFEAAPRRSLSARGGGGNFDGAWIVVGVGTSCPGSSTSAVVVSSGRIIGQGVSGTVSASGAAHAIGNANGVTVISSGHLSGRSGSGSFRQSDGCVGRWTAAKN